MQALHDHASLSNSDIKFLFGKLHHASDVFCLVDYGFS